jgi:hypothetical protein
VDSQKPRQGDCYYLRVNPALSSSRAKIERAKDHFNNLCSALNARGAEQADRPVSTQFDSQRRSFEIPQEESPPTSDWALAVGDIVHNLRSALDHLAVQLAILNGNTMEQASAVVFPVCLTHREFLKSTKRFKNLVSPSALTALEWAQPYYAAKVRNLPAENNVLWIISKLDNIDKHRILVIIEEAGTITNVTVTSEDGWISKPPIQRDVWVPIEDRVELASVDFSGVDFEGQEKVNMDVHASVDVFLNEPELGLGAMKLRIILSMCVRYTEIVVDSFGTDFFGE